MTNFVIDIGRVRDGVRNFVAQEPSVTLTQIM
jgi:hypothetical protein